jgi:hypothetical protein
VQAKYDSRVRGRAAQIGRVLGWPAYVIKQRAQQLGIARPRPDTRRDWTPDEEAALERYAGKRTSHWIAKHLKRSVTSIVVKLKRMRLSRCPEGLNQQGVADAFGCSRDTVEAWLRKGWLQASYPARTNGERYGITDADLVAFIRGHRTAFDLRSVNQPWFLDLVLGDVAAVVVSTKVVHAASVKQAFLDALEQAGGNVSVALAAVNLSRSGLYSHLLRQDPAFARQFDALRVRLKFRLARTATPEVHP